MRSVLIPLASLLILPGVAVAKDAKKDPSERRICKREAVTGTRAGAVKICRTKHEWDLLKEEALHATDIMVRDQKQEHQEAMNPPR